MWPNVIVVANTDLMYLSTTVNTINKSTPKKWKRSNICHKNIEELCNFIQHTEKRGRSLGINQGTHGSMSRWSFLFFEKLFLGTELQQGKNNTFKGTSYSSLTKVITYFFFINMVYISSNCLKHIRNMVRSKWQMNQHKQNSRV